MRVETATKGYGGGGGAGGLGGLGGGGFGFPIRLPSNLFDVNTSWIAPYGFGETRVATLTLVIFTALSG